MAAGEPEGRIVVTPDVTEPLDESLRTDLFSLLLSQNKIKELQNTLSTSCTSSGWQSKVEERVLQLLRNGEVRNVIELERLVVGEALSRDLLGEEAREEMEDRKARRNAQKEASVDVRVPDTAVKAGTRIVREVLERSVDVKEEQLEDREWKDWR